MFHFKLLRKIVLASFITISLEMLVGTHPAIGATLQERKVFAHPTPNANTIKKMRSMGYQGGNCFEIVDEVGSDGSIATYFDIFVVPTCTEETDAPFLTSNTLAKRIGHSLIQYWTYDNGVNCTAYWDNYDLAFGSPGVSVGAELCPEKYVRNPFPAGGAGTDLKAKLTSFFVMDIDTLGLTDWGTSKSYYFLHFNVEGLLDKIGTLSDNQTKCGSCHQCYVTNCWCYDVTRPGLNHVTPKGMFSGPDGTNRCEAEKRADPQCFLYALPAVEH